MAAITSATAPCSVPPSLVKSFWNSIMTNAVVFGFIDYPSFFPALALGLCPGARNRVKSSGVGGSSVPHERPSATAAGPTCQNLGGL